MAPQFKLKAGIAHSLIIDLHMKGKTVVIVGAGSEGLKKIKALISQGCKIIVFDREAGAQVRRYARDKKITFKKTGLSGAGFLVKYRPDVVMLTTDDSELNHAILEKARKMGCMVYSSDEPELSDFAHPSVINLYGVVQVAVSTGGRSPVMARRIRQEAERVLAKTISREDILQIRIQEAARAEAKKHIPTQAGRKRYLYAVINDAGIKQLIKDNRLGMARRRAAGLLRDWK